MATATKEKKKTNKKKAAPALAIATLGTFDTGQPNLRIKFDGVPVKELAPLTFKDYAPRGGTPLNDAVLGFINKIESNFSKRPTDTHIGLLLDESGSMDRLQSAVVEGINTFIDGIRNEEVKNAGKVLVVIMTDGLENASIDDPDGSKVRDLLSKKEEEGWDFMYLGANQDSWAAGRSLGSNSVSTYSHNFAHTSGGTRTAMGDTTLRAASAKLKSDDAYMVANMSMGGQSTADEPEKTWTPGDVSDAKIWTPEESDAVKKAKNAAEKYREE